MLTLRSPAKVNLYFKVLNKRSDGFHTIASLYQAISIFDRLSIQLADADQLTCDQPYVPTDESNLISKAIAVYRKETQWMQPFSIHLEKNIPSEAGLGGGSSNAATTLYALNQLSGHGFTDEELMQMAAQVGSDPAFFLSKGVALCEGKGEEIYPLSPLPFDSSFYIAKPSFGCSTPAVYRALNVAQLPQWDHRTALKEFQEGKNAAQNDLECPAFSLDARLKEVKQFLSSAGAKVVMTGSGSSFMVFGSLPEQVEEAFQLFKVECIGRSEKGWY